ncbi:membrane protein insertion efficiency factor YidD [Paracidobacterium acidisoli]|uniref:Putative membrane protein insertion efficiency factor n=1 Tax=Paracidobacterium acidisoli TaxID=2303751 RepID=A0A372IML2_9BACT|nr:membrane protein insertion efficiency factor YidD [Paracidobacterium acidisoli]
MRARERIAAAALAVYKYAVSPLLHAVTGASGACRFHPTCSEYAALAVSEHGLVRGSLMAAGRLLRCHPFHRGGFDPVPSREEQSFIRRTGPASYH